MLNIRETPFTGYAFSSTFCPQTGISSRYLKYHFFLRAEYRTTTGIQQFSTFRYTYCPEAFEKFEAAFPKKEKLKLLGQLF